MSALNERHLPALLAGAFAVRLVVFLLFQPWADETVTRHVIVNDAAEYHSLAQCIVFERSFCGNALRTPGYPLYVAAFYGLFGEQPWIVLLSQIFLDLGTMLLIFRIGQLVFNNRVGLIAAALYGFDPNAIFTTAALLTDPLFVCLLLAGVYTYLRALLKGEFTSAAASGVLLGLATLVRPVAEYFFVFLALFAVFWSVQKLGARLRITALLVLAFGVTISPWLYRNHTLYDTVGLSSIQGENLLYWQVTAVKAWETGRSTDAIRAEFRSEAERRGYQDDGNPFENAAIAQDIAVEYISARPNVYAYRLLTGIVHTFGNLSTAFIVQRMGFSPSELPHDALSASRSEWDLVKAFFATKSTLEILVGLSVLLLLLAHYSSSALGAVVLLSARQYAVLLLFVAAIAYFAVTGGPIGLARFRLPATPFYLLLGGVFIDHLLNRIRASRQPNVGTPGN